MFEAHRWNGQDFDIQTFEYRAFARLWIGESRGFIIHIDRMGRRERVWGSEEVPDER